MLILYGQPKLYYRLCWLSMASPLFNCYEINCHKVCWFIWPTRYSAFVNKVCWLYMASPLFKMLWNKLHYMSTLYGQPHIQLLWIRYVDLIWLAPCSKCCEINCTTCRLYMASPIFSCCTPHCELLLTLYSQQSYYFTQHGRYEQLIWDVHFVMGPSDRLFLIDSGYMLFAFGQQLAKTSNQHLFRDIKTGVLVVWLMLSMIFCMTHDLTSLVIVMIMAQRLLCVVKYQM